jgi:signal transduction histidine kinase
VSTAIANAQARSELEQLLDEQAALRRVATLVARRGSPQDVFEAVTLEASRLLGDKSTALLRYEPEGDAVLVAVRRGGARIGMRVPAEGDSLTARVARTGRPARIDTYEGVAGVEVAREVGVGAAVAAPIVVEDRLWGLILAMTRASPLPAGTENRLAQFAELVAAAIGNAESRAELSASRARIVAAGDEARRRIQRDLHDGAQQRLVHTIMTLKLAKAALGDETGPVADFLHESLEQAERANAELRELVHGILPASLSRGGLRAGIGSLIGRIGLPVSADVAVGRLSRSLETTAYFIVAEALTNVVKHARATSARVSVAVAGGALRLEVSDDGAGGADRSRGTGLLGLADRVGASGGTISLTSPPGEGTTLVVLLPLDDGEARPTALPPTSRS